MAGKSIAGFQNLGILRLYSGGHRGPHRNTQGTLVRATLEGGGQAHGNASRRPDGIAGEKPTEVDHVKNIVEVLSVDLKAHIHSIRLVYIHARRGVDLKSGIDAAASEVDAIYDGLSVGLSWSARSVDTFLKSYSWIALKIEWQAAVKLNTAGKPEARIHLVAKTSANRVALVL